MFKVNNKDTRTTPLAGKCQVNEQVNARWPGSGYEKSIRFPSFPAFFHENLFCFSILQGVDQLKLLINVFEYNNP